MAVHLEYATNITRAYNDLRADIITYIILSLQT